MDDPELAIQLARESDQISGELRAKELELLFTDPYAAHNALISISPGAGGVDPRTGPRC